MAVYCCMLREAVINAVVHRDYFFEKGADVMRE